MSADALLEVEDLAVRFDMPGAPWRRRRLTALDGVDFHLDPGETLGVVGESGCGKSTLARAIVGTVRPHRGRLAYHGTDLDGPPGVGPRRRIRMVFQDPLGALNPRMTVAACVAEPLGADPALSRRERSRRVVRVLEDVGLSSDYLYRYPHELSGGQGQRVGIARALVDDPGLMICDEPVSALDLSIRAQVVNLLLAAQARTGMSMLFIAHDLGIVSHVSDRVMVLYLGRVMEVLPAASLANDARHPYTRALLASAPVPAPGTVRRRAPIQGEPPSPLDLPAGCVFRGRCPRAAAVCAEQAPRLDGVAVSHQVACHFPHA